MAALSIIIIFLWCVLISGSTYLVFHFIRQYRSRTGKTGETAPAIPAGTPPSTVQLQVSKTELELVFDAIPEQVCILDKELTIIRANKSYADFLHLHIRELLGKKCYKLFWGDACRCNECPAGLTFGQGIAIKRKLFTRTVADTVRHFEISTFPVFDQGGAVLHVIEFTKDITEEKRMVEHVIRSEKLASIGNMTAGIAHEMNNPLSGISGNAANLLRMPQKYGLNEKGISRVTTILNSAAHATAIMDDLLHLSQRPEQTTVLVNINALLVKTANAVHLDGSQEIERSFSIDEKIPPVSCDPSKIQQVIVHVVENAMLAILDRKKRIRENEVYKGNLSIATQRTAGEVLITISDNGIGIPEEHRTKIFDPFFSTRPTGQGTGLGLSVSHKIIEEHHGKMFFECVENTTRFSILLPLERNRIPAAAPIH